MLRNVSNVILTYNVFMARIRIITIKQDDKYLNLYTGIVFSRKFKKTKKLSYKETIENEKNKIIIFEGFLSNNKLKKLKNEIIEQQELIIDNYKLNFNIDKNIRKSFLLTIDDTTTNSHKQVLSCFKNNCYLYENWCIDNNIKDLWLNLDENIRKNISEKSEIELLYLIDRIGNILHFQEIEEINIAFFHQNNAFLTFSVSMRNKFVPNKYIANIEVKSFDDIILKESFIIKERFKDFDLQDEDYNIHIEVYNFKTGECVFDNNFAYLKEISLGINVLGNEIVFKDDKGRRIHSIQQYSRPDISTVSKNNKSKIIKYQLARERYANEYSKYNLLSTFKGFKGVEYSEAEKYFQKLLKQISNTQCKYVYIADPYFLSAHFDIRRFIVYLDIFATVQDKEVRVLTCNTDLPKSLKNFIKKNKKNKKNKLFGNIKIKSIIEKSQIENKPLNAFHDRWIASDIEEYGFTNSLNNFKNGVSFFKSLKHYYQEAEFLWQINSDDENYIVEEFNLYE